MEQDFQLVSVDAANAKHVGAVFQSVYGNDFPIQYVYQPEAVAAEIAAERLTAVLAFDAEGQPAGYVSMFKNAPNFQLWEVGNMVVNPVYRQSRLSLLLANCCQSAELMNIAGSDGLYSEAVCHHYMTQVGSAKAGMADYALEIDQLAGSSFKEHCADTERISCVFNFIEYTKPSLPTYIPHVYEDMARTLLQPLKKRDILVSTAVLPQQGNLRQEEKYYEFAGTWKLAVWETGATWSEDVAGSGAPKRGQPAGFRQYGVAASWSGGGRTAQARLLFWGRSAALVRKRRAFDASCIRRGAQFCRS